MLPICCKLIIILLFAQPVFTILTLALNLWNLAIRTIQIEICANNIIALCARIDSDRLTMF